MKITSENLMSTSGLELLNKIFLSAGEGIVIVDASGVIKLINKRAEELFEYDQNELIGHVIEDLIPQQYRERHVGYRDGYIAHPVSRPMGSGRYLMGLKKSGQTFPVEVSLSFVTHEEEKLVVAFVTDITLRKQQEDALADSKKKLEEYATELETKVRQRTRELEHLNLGLKSQIRERKLAEAALKESLKEIKKAEQEILKALEKEKELNELKSRFISMASHEFRTPLTTILSSVTLLSKYTESDQQDRRDKHIERITHSVQNLTNILNDFLSLERLESGGITVKPTAFDLRQLLDELAGSFELSLKKDQQLQIEVNAELAQLQTDPHLVKNILINLISNAIKYSAEGSLVEVAACPANEHVEISIRDEGIGIPESEQKNLFQRFYRAENATNIQGTGLGLNIVQRYLKLLGGQVSFSSQEGAGSEFIVRFPITHTT